MDSALVSKSEPVRQPLSLGKLIVGVVVGVLAAVAVICAISYGYSEYVGQRDAPAKIAHELNQIHDRNKAENLALELDNDRLEDQTRALEPGNPCNVLVNKAYRDCTNIEGLKARRKFAKSVVAETKIKK